MADDQRQHDEPHAAIAYDARADGAEQQAPKTQEQQRVRVRIRDEVERREGGDARLDAHLFDADRNQQRPQEVRELRGGEKHRQ